MSDIKFIRPVEREEGKGYVYIVRIGENYKIGKSIQPSDRCKEYTKLFEEPEVVCCEYVANYSSVESELHSMFDSKRKRGEWFLLSGEEVEVAKRFIKDNIEVKPNIVKGIEECLCEKVKMDWKADFYSNDEDVVNQLIKYPSTYIAISILRRYMCSDNVVRKGNRRFRCNDLAKELGVSRQMANIHLKRLREINVIKDVEINGVDFVAINPYYYFRGDEIPDNIAELFNNNEKVVKDDGEL